MWCMPSYMEWVRFPTLRLHANLMPTRAGKERLADILKESQVVAKEFTASFLSQSNQADEKSLASYLLFCLQRNFMECSITSLKAFPSADKEVSLPLNPDMTEHGYENRLFMDCVWA